MEIDSYTNIIKQGENETVEFKKNFDNSVLISLNAFANSKGGKVLIGIKDDGGIFGVKLNKETLQNWINEIKNKTNPSIIPSAEVVDIENKTIVLLEVAEYPIKPVAVRGRYYKRVKNSNHQMSITEIADEHFKTVNSSWDFYPAVNYSLADLSEEKIYRFIKQIGLNSDILTFLNKFELIKDKKITFGAFLLFADIEPIISTVEIGRFASETIIKDSLTVRSDLLSEVDQIFEFIKSI